MKRSAILLYATFFVALGFALNGCKDNVVTPGTTGAHGILIVNEGQFQSDNASLSRIDESTGTLDKSWFSQMNSGQKLGATANDIVQKGDTAYIAVTDSRVIEVIQLSTGKSLGRVNFGVLSNLGKPRKIVLINDTLACASTYLGNGVAFFNPKTFELQSQVQTGPATEGIATNGTLVYVANSGLGDLAKDNPGAGTVTVINVQTKNVVATLNVGVNVTELTTNADRTKLYAYYQHSYLFPDSLQGIVEFDAKTFTELRRFRFKSIGNMKYYNSALYFFNVSGFSPTKILKIDLLSGGMVETFNNIDPAIISPYGFAFNPANGNLWITDAKDYKSNGEVKVHDNTGKLLKTLEVGVNPKNLLYY